MSILHRHRAVLLDMNGTFMFGHDRLGLGEDFHATYRSLGGTGLSAGEVRKAVLSCCGSLAVHYDDPAPCLQSSRMYQFCPTRRKRTRPSRRSAFLSFTP